MKSRICWLVLLMLVPLITHAQTYKCKQPNGLLSFQDQPCLKGAVGSAIPLSSVAGGNTDQSKWPRKSEMQNAVDSISAHGETCRYFDGFTDNQNGTITDPRDGLVWQRCVAGQSWTGADCKGEGLGMSWWEAMQSAKDNQFLSKSDWRLPTAEELKAIVGKHEDCLISDETKKPWRAVSRMFPAVKSDGFVGAFWSSTTFTSSGAWVVYFFDGGAFSVGRNAQVGSVRLVRGGNPVGREEFDREFASMSSSPYWPGHTRK